MKSFFGRRHFSAGFYSQAIIFLLFGSFLLACNNSIGNDDVIVESEDPPKADSSRFKNPVLDVGPDPWVIQEEEEYFVTYTTGRNLLLMRTDKMSELKNGASKVVWVPPASGMNSAEIWAPELHRIDGKWYLYYAASDGQNKNHKMWVLENTAQDPFEGSWIDRGELELPDDKWAIDGSPVVINDQRYFAWSGWEGDVNVRQNIYIAEMQDPLTVVGERVRLLAPAEPWEINNVNPQVVEGPQFLQNDGKVFLFYSAGGCWTDGYSIGALWMEQGKDPLQTDSWQRLENNPLFTSNPSGNTFGPGHNSFFKSLDGEEDWIFYHANPRSDLGCADDRSARIQKIAWDSEGFPLLGIPAPLATDLEKPGGEF